MLAEQTKMHAERLLASPAELAAAIADAGIDHHAIAGREAVHRTAHLVHGARSVRADDPVRTHRRPRKAPKDEQIEMVERDGVHAHAHVRGSAERGNRKIGNDLQLLQPAVGGDRERSHGVVVPLY